MSSIDYAEKGIEEIRLIEPLWKQLNAMHVKNSRHFSEGFVSNAFEHKEKSIIEKSRKGKIRIYLARDVEEDKYIGFCISSVSAANEGEIETIFIEREYRGKGIGDRLMEDALEWMHAYGATTAKIVVVYGNEGVLPFYKKHGFYPRNYVLSRKK